MFRRINSKALSILFAVLLSIVIVVHLIDLKKGSRTFKSNLVNVEAGTITSIEIYPKTSNGTLIKLFKEDEGWKVASDGEKYNADQSTTNRIIAQLNNLKPKSVVATKQDSWEKYEVTDSLGTRVKLFKGAELMANLVIGKFSYSQPGKITSYVRLSSEKEVYGVDGMLGSLFNRNLTAFRDRTIIKSDKTDWTRLTFEYPADSSFVLEKIGTDWMIGNVKADSASVAQYFNKISNLTDGSFAEQKPEIAPTHLLTIEGNNLRRKIDVAGYYTDSENFVLSSNLNPDSYFKSSSAAEKIFVGKKGLINSGINKK